MKKGSSKNWSQESDKKFHRHSPIFKKQISNIFLNNFENILAKISEIVKKTTEIRLLFTQFLNSLTPWRHQK